MKKEEDKKKDNTENLFSLKTILDLDKPQIEPANNKLELDDSDRLELKGYSGLNQKSEIELKQALDILKSLKPNDELILAINLIENALEREKLIYK